MSISDKTKSWIDNFHFISKEVETHFAGLNVETLYAKPHPQQWSIAENLQHLITINRSYYPIFDNLKRGTYHGAFIGRFPFFTKMFGDMVFKSISDGGKKKYKTFPLWEPKVEIGDPEIIGRFMAHQREFEDKIQEMIPFLEKKAVIHSPANKLIVYTLERAFDIITAHELRHLDQAKRALEAVTNKL